MKNIIHYDKIPNEIKSLKQWVLWKCEVPKTRFGGNARINDPSAWSIFDSVKEAYDRSANGLYDGIGFVLNYNDEFVGIDISNVIVDGVIPDDIMELIKEFNSYAEISPSGKGIRIFIQGKLPDNCPKKAKTYQVCDTGNFFSLTGNHIPDTPLTINKANQALNHYLDLIEKINKDEAIKKKREEQYPDIDDAIPADLRKYIHNAMRDVYLAFDGTTKMEEEL